jgi:hypothetical protein
VQIAEEDDLSDFLNAHDEFFEVEDLGVVYFGGVFPLLVEVVARDVGAVVAVDDSVGVEHGHDLEDEVLPELPGLLVAGDEELDDAVADVGADGLAGVDPGRDDDVGLVEFLVWIGEGLH